MNISYIKIVFKVGRDLSRCLMSWLLRRWQLSVDDTFHVQNHLLPLFKLFIYATPRIPGFHHCMKSVQIPSFFWSVFSRIRTEYGDLLFSPNAGKYGPEKTPYLDTFHAVYPSTIFKKYRKKITCK